MTVDFSQLAAELTQEELLEFLPAIKVLTNLQAFDRLIRMNKTQLLDGGVAWDASDDVFQRVKELTQTNKTLLILQESANQLTEGMNNA